MNFAKVMGIIFLVVMLGGLTGGSTVTDPFHGSKLVGSPAVSQQPAISGAGLAPSHAASEFKHIKTVEDLNGEIMAANASGKTVMLDFYADWCSYCKTLERYVFPDPGVQDALTNTVLLQADVTKMDKEDRRLMEHLGVKLPPTIIFFDTNGSEMRQYRVVGELSVDEFRAHARKAVGVAKS